MDDTRLEIVDLLLAGEGEGALFQLGSAEVVYDIGGAPRGSCTVKVIAKYKPEQADDSVKLGLTVDDVATLSNVFYPGAPAKVICGMCDVDENYTEHTLFDGFVSSVMDTMSSNLENFEYVYTVELTTPELLIPTNPTASSFSISRGAHELQLVSDVALSGLSNGNQDTPLYQHQEILNKLHSTSELNIAQVTADVLDKTSQYSSGTTLPTGIAAMVDTSTAPIISLPTETSAADVAKQVVIQTGVEQVKSGTSDWSIFVKTLNDFYLMVVPTAKVAADEQTGAKSYLKVIKNCPWAPWDKEHGLAIDPSAFTGFQSVHGTGLSSHFRAVAVAYPQGYADKANASEVDKLANNILIAAGYDKERNPKWAEVTISTVQGSGDYSQLSDLGIKSIERLTLPNWALHLYAKQGNQSPVPNNQAAALASDNNIKALAGCVAKAELLSQLGVQGSLLIRTRLLPAIDFATHMGEVVKIKLPIAAGDLYDSLITKTVYGMLRTAKISIILSPTGLTANGSVTIVAVRGEQEQAVFARKSGLFKDEQGN